MVVRLFGHFCQEFLTFLLEFVSKQKWREIYSCQNGGKNFGKPASGKKKLSPGKIGAPFFCLTNTNKKHDNHVSRTLL